jgi:hypothetical protein
MIHKEPTTIGIKEFHKNFVKIAQKAKKGQSFVVVKHSEPLFKIEPPENTKKYNLQDFKKIQFKSKDKDLSKNIDQILYGV